MLNQVGLNMRYPAIATMRIMAADRRLFEHIMKNLGFKLTPHRHDPTSAATVQTEAITAIASVMTEGKVPLYFNQLKEMAERLGYIALLENPMLPQPRREISDEERYLENDAREMGMDDPDFMTDPDAEMDINAPTQFGPRSSMDRDGNGAMTDLLDAEDSLTDMDALDGIEPEATGEELWQQIMADVQHPDNPLNAPPTDGVPW
jgi:hypothetical protein